MAFPTTLPSYIITTGSESVNGAGGGTGLSGLLNAFEVDITALGTKLGTGAAVPAANQLLVGNGAGTSTWQGLTSAQLAAIVSDETGSGALVFGTSPTIVTPTIASFTNAQHDHSNAAGGGTINWNGLPLGSVVQTVVVNSSTVNTGTTIIPYDDTLPQITEGTEFLTGSITPKAVTNRLLIEVKLYTTASIVETIMGALFQDSTANALAATAVYQGTATGEAMILLTHDMAAGTTSATTFRARVGGESASTITYNGRSGVRKFGGATLSTFKITEYKA